MLADITQLISRIYFVLGFPICFNCQADNYKLQLSSKPSPLAAIPKISSKMKLFRAKYRISINYFAFLFDPLIAKKNSYANRNSQTQSR